LTFLRPIYTYEHRGCNKKGVRPEEHGIVYGAAGKPHLLNNEPTLVFMPVPVVVVPGERLAKQSRACYAKLENIEHFAPVRFIGTVDPESYWVVEDAVEACWDNDTEGQHHWKDRKELCRSRKKHSRR
jgi:hypothetical protein